MGVSLGIGLAIVVAACAVGFVFPAALVLCLVLLVAYASWAVIEGETHFTDDVKRFIGMLTGRPGANVVPRTAQENCNCTGCQSRRERGLATSTAVHGSSRMQASLYHLALQSQQVALQQSPTEQTRQLVQLMEAHLQHMQLQQAALQGWQATLQLQATLASQQQQQTSLASAPQAAQASNVDVGEAMKL
eukprot:m51a1_g9679 hypothetical protein (190) ;mRNA; f:1292177-1293328